MNEKTNIYYLALARLTPSGDGNVIAKMQQVYPGTLLDMLNTLKPAPTEKIAEKQALLFERMYYKDFA